MSTEDVLPGNPVSIQGRRVKGGRPSNGDILQFNSTTQLWENGPPPAGTPHDLLDGNVDQDTVASAVVKGGLIFGNATPKWDQLPRAAADGAILVQSSELPSWLAAGTDGYLLIMTAGAPAWTSLGASSGYLKGGNPPTLQTGIPLVDLLNAGGAAGDVLYWDGTNWVRLAKDVGKFLKSEAASVSWDTPTATVTITKQEVVLSSDFTSSSGSYVDVTGMTVTLPNRAGGYATISFIVEVSGTTANFNLRLVDNGVAQSGNLGYVVGAALPTIITLVYNTTLSGQVVKLQLNPNTNSITIKGTASDRQSKVESLEIGG